MADEVIEPIDLGGGETLSIDDIEPYSEEEVAETTQSTPLAVDANGQPITTNADAVITDEFTATELPEGYSLSLDGGLDYQIENMAHLISLAQQGANTLATGNNNSNNNVDPMLASLAEHGIDASNVSLLIDAFGGDAGAIATLAKNGDAVEALNEMLGEDGEIKYTPQSSVMSRQDANFMQVYNSLPNGQQALDSVSNDFDADSINLILQTQPEFLKGISADISSGVYGTIVSQTRLDISQGKHPDSNFANAYIKTAKSLFGKSETQPQNNPTISPENVKKNVKKSVKTSTTQTHGKTLTIKDIDNMSQEQYAAYYKKKYGEAY